MERLNSIETPNILNISLQMFNSMTEIEWKEGKSIVEILNNIHEYNMKDGTSQQIVNKLKVSRVRVSEKGKLGSYVVDWDGHEGIKISDEEIEKMGSIQITSTTEPGNLNISLLYYMKTQRLKISGKLLDTVICAGIGQEQHIEDLEKCISYGIQVYMENIYDCCFSMFKSIKKTCEMKLMNGMFDIGYKIMNVESMSVKKHEYITYSEGQEPELNGRMFSISLELKNNTKLILDHTGKVQIFKAKKFEDIVRSMKEFYKYMNICIEEKVITLKKTIEHQRCYVAQNTHLRGKYKY